LLFAAALLAAFILFVILVSKKVRKGGGSLTTTGLGAVDAFLDRDKKKSAEEIVNKNAGIVNEGEKSSGSDK
jgi:hypothetical protein